MQLKINDLSKTYPNGKKALINFTAEFDNGIYAILGPNGAGKSTLMNCITGNLTPTGGKIFCDGKDVRTMGPQFRSMLGYMPQQQGLYDTFTAKRFLWYMAALKGLSHEQAKKRIGEVLELVNLTDVANRRLGGFSGGMKQRVLIAQALLADPQLIILDEPTAGLDPKERIRIRNFISEISINKTVLFATHVVPDIEFIAKEVLMLRRGELVTKQSPQTLLAECGSIVWEVAAQPDQLHRLEQQYNVSNLYSGEDGRVMVRVVGDRPQEEFVTPAAPTLEDIYLHTFHDETAADKA